MSHFIDTYQISSCCTIIISIILSTLAKSGPTIPLSSLDAPFQVRPNARRLLDSAPAVGHGIVTLLRWYRTNMLEQAIFERVKTVLQLVGRLLAVESKAVRRQVGLFRCPLD